MTKNTKQQSSTIELEHRKAWDDYGLLAENVKVNGTDTGRFILTQQGKFVQIFSDLYHVLPNQDVLKIADRVAKRNKCSTYTPIERALGKYSWAKSGVFGDSHPNALTNSDGTRMVANYIFPEKVDVTGDKDFVQFGFGVRNGIDKMTAFSCYGMSVRMICDNIMLHLAGIHTHREGMETGWNGQSTVRATDEIMLQKSKVQQAKSEFSKGIRKLHFKGLTEEFVENGLNSIKEQHYVVLKRYREMVDLKLAQVQADELVKRMPKSVRQTIPYLQGIYEKVGGKNVLTKVNILDRKDPKGKEKPTHPKLWDVFNDFTNSLTFAERRQFSSNLGSYEHLDKILVQV